MDADLTDPAELADYIMSRPWLADLRGVVDGCEHIRLDLCNDEAFRAFLGAPCHWVLVGALLALAKERAGGPVSVLAFPSGEVTALVGDLHRDGQGEALALVRLLDALDGAS